MSKYNVELATVWGDHTWSDGEHYPGIEADNEEHAGRIALSIGTILNTDNCIYRFVYHVSAVDDESDPIGRCSVCGRTFTDEEWDDRHWPHEEGCGIAEKGYCHCDLEVHVECCPNCNEGSVQA